MIKWKFNVKSAFVFSIFSSQEKRMSKTFEGTSFIHNPSSIKTMWDATPKHQQTEWVLHSDDWQDIVITHIHQCNDTPIEDNYTDLSLKGIKDAYFKLS